MKWRPVTKNGLGSNTIFWSIETSSPTHCSTAARSRNGIYATTLTPPSNTGGAALPKIRDVSDAALAGGAAKEGQTTETTNGTWDGTETIEFTYQWQWCFNNGTNCTDIAGETDQTYVVKPADFNDGSVNDPYRFRSVVTATNPFPDFGTYTKESAITAATTAKPGNLPGDTQSNAPGFQIVDPGDDDGQANVGDTLHGTEGTAPSAFSDGWFNPQATTSTSWQWDRCDNAGTSAPRSGRGHA